MKKFLRGGVAVLMFLAVASCSSDNEDSPATIGEGTITAKINGENWTGTVSSVTLIRVASENAQRFDISAEDSSQRLSLAIESAYTTEAGMPLASYNFPDNALFLNSYKINGNYYGEHMPETGTLTITSINTSTKKISGTFSFTNTKSGVLQTQIVTPEVVEVTEGNFTNLSYTVLDL